MGLRYPWRRVELVEYLKELSDADYQKKVWLRGERSGDEGVSGIDVIYHFLFDDTDLGSNAESEIGLCLLSREEAGLIKELAHLLESLLERNGDADSKTYMKDSEWAKVIDLSKITLESIH